VQVATALGRVQRSEWPRRLMLVILISVVSSSQPAHGRARSISARPPQYTIVGENYAFHPSRIVVHADDAVKITFIAKDRPYTLAIDEYRISRRAAPGAATVIEFCADRVGSFVYYCNLTDDERRRGMRGELVVQ
jgi:heme/copper-type cytochrome/quinol oxidase subunit 2